MTTSNFKQLRISQFFIFWWYNSGSGDGRLTTVLIGLNRSECGGTIEQITGLNMDILLRNSICSSSDGGKPSKYVRGMNLFTVMACLTGLFWVVQYIKASVDAGNNSSDSSSSSRESGTAAGGNCPCSVCSSWGKSLRSTVSLYKCAPLFLLHSILDLGLVNGRFAIGEYRMESITLGSSRYILSVCKFCLLEQQIPNKTVARPNASKPHQGLPCRCIEQIQSLHHLHKLPRP